MAAIIILSVIVLGTSKFSYFAATDSKWAANQIAAARIALMLVESWRGASGSTTYDPVASLDSGLAIEQQNDGPISPEDFTILGNYKIEIDNSIYYAALSWKDISPGLRALHINIIHPKPSSVSESDITTRFSQDDFGRREKLFQMTTYTTY